MTSIGQRQIVFIWFEQFAWIAHIVDEDVMAQGATPTEALARLELVKKLELAKQAESK